MRFLKYSFPTGLQYIQKGKSAIKDITRICFGHLMLKTVCIYGVISL